MFAEASWRFESHQLAVGVSPRTQQQQPASASGRPVTVALQPALLLLMLLQRRPVATTAATRSDLSTSGGATTTTAALKSAQPADRQGNLIPAQNGATLAGQFPTFAWDPCTGRSNVHQRKADDGFQAALVRRRLFCSQVY